MVSAFEQLQPLPCAASDLGLTSPGQSYALQALYVKQLAPQLGGIAGYKVALTNPATQRRFRYHQAITGVLFKNGLLRPGALILRREYFRLFIEVEMAFFIKGNITEPLADQQQLLAHVASVAPAIELPDVNIGQVKRMTGLDIIASNEGARYFIIGKPRLLQGLALDRLEVVLYRNCKEIARGVGSATLGGQYKALLWAVNNIVKYSGPIQDGQVILTGSLISTTPGKPGVYRSTYGALGEIAFSVK